MLPKLVLSLHLLPVAQDCTFLADPSGRFSFPCFSTEVLLTFWEGQHDYLIPGPINQNPIAPNHLLGIVITKKYHHTSCSKPQFQLNKLFAVLLQPRCNTQLWFFSPSLVSILPSYSASKQAPADNMPYLWAINMAQVLDLLSYDPLSMLTTPFLLLGHPYLPRSYNSTAGNRGLMAITAECLPDRASPSRAHVPSNWLMSLMYQLLSTSYLTLGSRSLNSFRKSPPIHCMQLQGGCHSACRFLFFVFFTYSPS